MTKNLLALAGLILALGAGAAQARDQIRVVGSSTVFPFSTAVAERFGKNTDFKTPVVEATGSGGGLKLFCGGIGVGYPDVTNSSRRIKETEVKMCADNGVAEIVEIKLGYDGIVVANSKKAAQYALTLKDLYLALAKDIPDATGNLVPNPHETWKDVDPDLPAVKIEILGPPPTSGTRDAFVELVMDAGCEEFDVLRALEKSDKNAFKAACRTVREDGAFVEAGENDNLIVQKLEANPDALGIFGFSFLDQNSDKVRGSKIEGVEPEFELIADGSYPVSRPLYFYVKKAHVGVIPGLEEFLAEFTSDRAWGDEGYLSDKGLIPMPEDERKEWADKAAGLTPLKM